MEWSCVLQVTRGRASIALDVARHVTQNFGISMSTQTVKRALQRSGLSSQQMKKKPHLFYKHVKARLDFARIHEHYTLDDWGRVIFTNELKINRFCSDGLS